MPRLVRVGLCVLVGAAVVIGGVGLAAARSGDVRAGAAAGGAVHAVAPTGSTEPAKGVLYVIGDSWSAGLYADSEHTLAQDAAQDVGMTATVDAESGTGYVTAPAGTRTYEQRAKAIAAGTRAEVVILQGGSNDGGATAASLGDAVRGTIAAVRHALPDATLVLLGPGPDPWPVTQQQRNVDDTLADAAAAESVRYVSPLREGWFTAANVGRIIDPRTDHPTVAGDLVLGGRLADALEPVLRERARSAG